MIRQSESQVRKALGGTKEVADFVGQGDFPAEQKEHEGTVMTGIDAFVSQVHPQTRPALLARCYAYLLRRAEEEEIKTRHDDSPLAEAASQRASDTLAEGHKCDIQVTS